MNMAEETLFEQILSGEIPSHAIGSGEGWFAFLDIFPRREGHTLVIPTTPVQRMAELSEVERSNLMNGVAAMWPHSPIGEPDHDALGLLASTITKAV
jgi:diadenosine tetraphosphate (Ap4A) HIT family hydrolase